MRISRRLLIPACALALLVILLPPRIAIGSLVLQRVSQTNSTREILNKINTNSALIEAFAGTVIVKGEAIDMYGLAVSNGVFYGDGSGLTNITAGAATNAIPYIDVDGAHYGQGGNAVTILNPAGITLLSGDGSNTLWLIRDPAGTNAQDRVGELESDVGALDTRLTGTEHGLLVSTERLDSAESGLLDTTNRLQSIEAAALGFTGRLNSAEAGLLSATDRLNSVESGLLISTGRHSAAEAGLLWLTNQTQISALSITNLESAAIGFSNRHSSTEAGLLQITSRLDSTESSIQGFTGRLDSAEAGLLTTTDRLNSVESDLLVSTGRHSSAEAGLLWLTNQTLQCLLGITNLESASAGFTNRLDSAEAGLLGLTVRVDSAEAAFLGFTGRISSAESGLLWLTNQVYGAAFSITNLELATLWFSNRLASAEAGLFSITSRVASIESGILDLTGRVESAESGLSTSTGRHDAAEAAILGFTGRLDSAEAGLLSVTGRLDGTEAGLLAMTGRTDSVEAGLFDLTNEVADVRGGTNQFVLLAGDTMAGELRGPDGTATNSYVTRKQLNDELAKSSTLILYGATNGHGAIAGAGSLWRSMPETQWAIVSTHASAGTNFVGAFWLTNSTDTLRSGGYVGRFWAVASGGGTKSAYMALVYSADNGATTNVLATCRPVPIGTSLTSYRLTAPYDSADITGANLWLGVLYYTVRTGVGTSGAVTTYGGGDYDTHLETPGIGAIGETDPVFTGVSNTFATVNQVAAISNLVTGASITPYVIPFAESNDISLINGNYQYYEPTGSTTIYLPAAATNQAHSLRLDLNVGTNSFTIATNGWALVTLSTNPVFTLSPTRVTGAIFDKPYNSPDWRGYTLP